MPEMEKGRPPENKRSRKPAHPVKREINQEMKTFAESTMNELLGWYGYDKLELRDSEATEIRNYPNRERRQQHVSVLKENSVPKSKSLDSPMTLAMRSGERESSRVPSSSPGSSSLTSPKEQKSAPVIVPLIKPSAVEDVQNVQIVCVWCQKEGVKRYSLCMGTELKSFCSEKCFAACRRAYFKRNKARDEDLHVAERSPQHTHADDSPRLVLNSGGARVCNWCKHVRHTKEYLDFGAGEERLQFCSTKCLNQYKMDVFYREARATLTSSSPGRPTQEGRPESTGGVQNQKLLTPESWSSNAGDVRGTTRSPKGQTPINGTAAPRTVSPSEASSSSLKVNISGLRHLERHVLPPPAQVASHHPAPHPPHPSMEHHKAMPQIPLPFIRPPLHAQGLKSPLANPQGPPWPPSSPIHQSPSLPHPPHQPHLQPPSATSMNPPGIHPYPGAYFPGLHSPPINMMGLRGPVPMLPMMNFGGWPSLGPFFPQPTVLVPYPIIVPIPVPIPIPIPIPIPPKSAPPEAPGVPHSGVIQPVPEGIEGGRSRGVNLPSPKSVVSNRLGRTTNQGLPSPSDHPRRDITDWVKSEMQAQSPMSIPHSAVSSPRARYDASPSSTSVIEGLSDFKLSQQQQPERQVIQRVLQRTPVKLEPNPHGVVDLSGPGEPGMGQGTRLVDTRVDHHNHHHDIIKPTPPLTQSPPLLHNTAYPQSPNIRPPQTPHQLPEGNAAALPAIPPPPPPQHSQTSPNKQHRHHPPILLPAQTPPSLRERPRLLALKPPSVSWRQSKRTAAPMDRSSFHPSPPANQRGPRPLATPRTPTSQMRTMPMPCPPPTLHPPERAVPPPTPPPLSSCPSLGTRVFYYAHRVWLDLGIWSLL
ncbi:LOW QUALITY PROTEIN: sine oculis-binding protein homolog B [Oncorhynchus tshawytscha]|uniref:LOW QUALITY PROTEIN: sine oculis-binding protein homolog B n=1 Tax=Oncorhynchus tshawytscha TaxID=74940 RepID=UPI001C3C46A4|nr:LOW QUALITY PROTEIN: sine oculis-binding protein homolog B [Oncorhynchus tshawytscha]